MVPPATRQAPPQDAPSIAPLGATARVPIRAALPPRAEPRSRRTKSMATRTIARMFDSYAAASAAVRDLEAAGFSSDNVSLIAHNAQGQSGGSSASPAHDIDRDGIGDRTESGAGTGAGIGAALGG